MVTMTLLAEELGVSRATVSLILNGHQNKERFTEETRRRVLEAAQQHGFHRNELMRASVSGKNHMIGFLVKTPRVESAARILDGALLAAETPGYTIKVMRLGGNPLDQAVIDRCIELRLAAVVALYLAPESLERLRAQLARYRIPLAVLDTHEPLTQGIRIEADDDQAMKLAVDHLFELGHRNIAFASGGEGGTMSQQREAAFVGAIKARGLKSSRIIHGNLDNAFTVEAVRQALQKAGRPTAIVCLTDGVALSCFRAARLAGLLVPRDLSVVGYGGVSLTEFVDPPLTTVSLPFQEIGETAIEQLLERVHASEGDFDEGLQQTLLPARLLSRESTAPPSEIVS